MFAVIGICYYFIVICSWFGNRGYPKKPVDNQLRRAAENRPEQLSEHQAQYGPGLSLVITHHPRVSS